MLRFLHRFFGGVQRIHSIPKLCLQSANRLAILIQKPACKNYSDVGMKQTSTSEADLMSSLPLAMAPEEEATIDLTRTSVRESICSIDMIAGSASMTAYKSPKPRKIIRRIAKQTTKTNQNGKVIVMSDAKLNFEESRIGIG